MSKQDQIEFINKFWVKFNTLPGSSYADVLDKYEINTLTKDIRNIVTGNILEWQEVPGGLDKKVDLVRSSGKSSSYHFAKISKACRAFM